MRRSQYLLSTERQAPAEAEIVSHKLLLRSGMIRKAAAGVYAFMPLGMRTLEKVMNIIRREMNAAGAQELLMPALQPADLWIRSGRWEQYGKEMMRLKDRHDRDFALAPTAEELVTSLVSSQISSYRQLPVNVYQIQSKYRDEIRPRFGLMRAREFYMKDAYSFDIDEAGLARSYQKMYEAYTRIFSSCGLDFRPVKAATGLMGGANSHEFHVLAESGEEELAYCTNCDYAANTEVATYRWERPQEGAASGEDATALEEVATPEQRRIEEVSEFLGVPQGQLIKTLLYRTSEGPVAVLVPGDRQANAAKLFSFFKEEVELIEPAEIETKLGLPFGFVGPVGLTIPVVVDERVAAMTNAVTGANKAGYHLRGVNPGRDFNVERTGDFHSARAGDLCPQCGDEIAIARGIEAGHCFMLGTKYSQALDACYTAEDGGSVPFVMGSYGIGVSRILAAAVEQHHDDNGISWPASIAPFHAALLPLVKEKEGPLWEQAEAVYHELTKAGVEVLMDDRMESPGVKFADADLIGMPFQIIMGNKSLASGEIEVKVRATGERRYVPRAGLVSAIQEWAGLS